MTRTMSASATVVAAPFGESLIGVLRESKIRHAREPVLHAVILVGREQFLRTQHAKNIGQIAADFVLAAFAAIQRHQQRAYAVTAGLEGSASRRLHRPDEPLPA